MSTGRRFVIHSCLGRGGFGEVYRATMEGSGGVRTEVAVKILRADIDPGSEAVKRLRDEGRLLGALRHPSILKVHDLVLLEHRVALVTEYIDGEDLDTCVHGGPERLPMRALVGAIGEVAAALDVAWNALAPGGHEAMHLVHRDVKPANIRVGKHGEVKLLDFGIARAGNVVREAQTAHNAMMGSYPYMAPERFHEEDVLPPSDVYALGCILFEGLVSEPFFADKTMKQIYGTMLSQKKFEAFRDERLHRLMDLPKALVDLTARLLDADPSRRPDAASVARACDDLAEELSGPTLKRWCRNRDWPPAKVHHGTLTGSTIDAETFGSGPQTPLPEAVPAVRLLDPLAAPDLLGGGDLLAMVDPFAGVGRGPLAATPAPAPEGRIGPPKPAEGVALRPVQSPPAAAPSETMSDPAGDGPPELPPAPTAELPPAPTPELPPAPTPDAPMGVERFAPPPPLVHSVEPTVDHGYTPAPQARTWEPESVPPAAEPELVAPPANVLPPEVPSVGQLAAPWAAPVDAAETLAPPIDDEEPTYEEAWLGDDPGPPPEPIPGVFDEPLPVVGHHAELDDGFDRELEAMAARRQRSMMLAGALMAVVVVGVLVVGGVVSIASAVFGDDELQPVRPQPVEGQDAPDPPAPEPATPDPVPAEPVPEEPAPAEPAPEPASTPALPVPGPAPAPVPGPAPAVVAPAPVSAKALVDRGWSVVERDPEAAASLFRQVLAQSPGDAEGSYGLGYALLELGRAADARPHLCVAARAGNVEVRRDVTSLLNNQGLSCD